jgi:hypothetical protein
LAGPPGGVAGARALIEMDEPAALIHLRPAADSNPVGDSLLTPSVPMNNFPSLFGSFDLGGAFSACCACCCACLLSAAREQAVGRAPFFVRPPERAAARDETKRKKRAPRSHLRTLSGGAQD